MIDRAEPDSESAADENPDVAAAVFGDRLPLASRYAELLAGDGVEHGLIGPRERDRLWDRHLINCAVVTELLPADARVVDVGSGAGLPGLVFACRRGDLRVDLLEPTQRRVDFLHRSVADLGLRDQVRVVRGRAESPAMVAEVGGALWVTARAVAPLDRLAAWCLPLLARGGRLLAMKGVRAEDEVREYGAAVRSVGGKIESIVSCGAGLVPELATVVVVARR